MLDLAKAIAKVHEFFVTMKKMGFSNELMEFFTHNEEEARKLVEFAKSLFRPAYKVVVDYSKTIVQMVEDGGYDWVNSDINDENFPIVGTGTTESEITLFHFGGRISPENAIAKMKKEGYRPANATELLALGQAQPDLQRKFRIVALGQIWQRQYNIPKVVCLRERVSKRQAILFSFYLDFSDDWCFAAVREEKLEA